MLDKFFAAFKTNAIHKTAMVTGVCSNVVKAFEQEYAQDHDTKKAAIDALIYLLEQHKNSLPEAQAPVNPA